MIIMYVVQHLDLKLLNIINYKKENVKIYELCQFTRKSIVYQFFKKVGILILILPIFIATMNKYFQLRILSKPSFTTKWKMIF
jgi:hypothetical protein